MHSIRMASAAALLAGFAAAALAQDKVDNPEYLSWARFTKGTRIKMRSVNSTDGRTTEVVTTSTLLDVTPERVVIESLPVVKDKAGDFSPNKPEKRGELRTIVLPNGIPQGLTREEYLMSKPPGATEEGTETIKIGQREIKTRWYKYKADVGGNALQGKRWVSPDVPGNVVKSEVTITGVFTSKLSLEIVEFEPGK